MEAFDIIGILLTLSAVFGFFNYKYIKLPTTIGLMLLGLIFSLIIIITGTFNNDFYVFAQNFVNDVRLDESLLGIMLSYLLFAGSTSCKARGLSESKMGHCHTRHNWCHSFNLHHWHSELFPNDGTRH